MSVELDKILNFAGELNITHAHSVPVSSIKLHQWVIDRCAANACGTYGKCWTCPPALGELSMLEERISGYSEAVLLQTIYELEDSWDFEGMERAILVHNDSVRQLTKRIKDAYPGAKVLPLGAGGCHFCEQCSCPDSPCQFPDQAIASVEGYGMDVKTMVESVGLKYINGQNTVSYVGLVLIAD